MRMSCVRGIFGWMKDGQDIAPRTLRCSLELIFFRTPTRWAGREKEFQLFLSPTAPDTGIRESRADPSTLSSTLYARSIPKRRCAFVSGRKPNTTSCIENSSFKKVSSLFLFVSKARMLDKGAYARTPMYLRACRRHIYSRFSRTHT